jgi:hypothetical protein
MANKGGLGCYKKDVEQMDILTECNNIYDLYDIAIYKFAQRLKGRRR